MAEYIVTVKYQLGIGYSELTGIFAIVGETMKEAKEYAKTLIPYNMTVTEIKAHKVKHNEIIPDIYRAWLYR